MFALLKLLYRNNVLSFLCQYSLVGTANDEKYCPLIFSTVE